MSRGARAGQVRGEDDPGREGEFLRLREAVNVDDLKWRDSLVRWARTIRAQVMAQKGQIEYWNRAHPEEQPIGTEFEDAVIAWCDGEGPMPTLEGE